MQPVSTCLWFDNESLEAAEFYVSLFPNSRIVEVSHYLEGTPRPTSDVLTVLFVLNGTELMALNGGPYHKPTPAMSLVANCDTQEEIDTLWQKLSEGGQEVECGWVTDRFGVSWQVVPRAFFKMLTSDDKAAAQRAFSAMMTMKKLDLAALERAYRGE
jgi:predicted 3-demethylubiquinone-9 3-methyltransferase (glyoxalase superfamily)